MIIHKGIREGKGILFLNDNLTLAKQQWGNGLIPEIHTIYYRINQPFEGI